MIKNKLYYQKLIYQTLKDFYNAETDREAKAFLLMEMKNVMIEMTKTSYGSFKRADKIIWDR